MKEMQQRIAANPSGQFHVSAALAFRVNCALKTFDLRPFTMSRHRCAELFKPETCEQCSPRQRNDLRGEKFTALTNRTKSFFVNRRLACIPHGRVRIDSKSANTCVD